MQTVSCKGSSRIYVGGIGLASAVGLGLGIAIAAHGLAGSGSSGEAVVGLVTCLIAGALASTSWAGLRSTISLSFDGQSLIVTAPVFLDQSLVVPRTNIARVRWGEIRNDDREVIERMIFTVGIPRPNLDIRFVEPIRVFGARRWTGFGWNFFMSRSPARQHSQNPVRGGLYRGLLITTDSPQDVAAQIGRTLGVEAVPVPAGTAAERRVFRYFWLLMISLSLAISVSFVWSKWLSALVVIATLLGSYAWGAVISRHK